MTSKIALIATGGTIASVGRDQFDLMDYTATGIMVDARTLVKRTGLVDLEADIIPIDFRRIDSTAITEADWSDLAELCWKLDDAGEVDGIVISHGTASLEETAWLLSLVLDLRIPVVLTGSMRPLSGVSSDAASNLAAAVQVAAAPCAAGEKVLVVVNDEIHSPRTVTKTHNLRLNAFQSPWHGPTGTIEGTTVRLARCNLPEARLRFHRDLLRRVPRVDIAYSYVGADGCAIRAFVAEGAKGIVSAAFGPGIASPSEIAALAAATAAGVVVVQSSRTGGGPVVDSEHNRSLGFIAGGDLNPQKARILLSLCLARGDSREWIGEVFAAH